MKVAKYYTSYTTGTLAGRDDGYPVTRRSVYDLDNNSERARLAADHGTQPNERYFRFTEEPIDYADMQAEVERIKAVIAEQKRENELANKRAQLQQLKRELGEGP
jgi:hypothetical protein